MQELNLKAEKKILELNPKDSSIFHYDSRKGNGVFIVS